MGQSNEASWIRLGAPAGCAHAQLDGFKTRALRTDASVALQRDVYGVDWYALNERAETGTLHGVVLIAREQNVRHFGHATLQVHVDPPKRHGAGQLAAMATLVVMHRASSTTLALPGLEVALSLVQAVAPAVQTIWLLTGGFSEAKNTTHADPGLWGLARSVRMESSLPLRCADPRALMLARGAPAAEPESLLRLGACIVPRLARVVQIMETGIAARCGSHVITGGTSGLGLLTARWLAQRGASWLALASRGGKLARDSVDEWERLSASNASSLAVQCDTSEAKHAQRLVATSPPTLTCVWHAAGVLADGTIPKQSHGSFARVYAPKAHGAWTLQLACSFAPLGAHVLFSSVVALLGGAGQANYSAANACLDALASCRRMRSLVGVAIQWGAWAEVGMAARGFASKRIIAMEEESGFSRISLSRGLAALHTAALPRGRTNVGIVPGSWHRMQGGAAVPALMVNIASRPSRAGPSSACVQPSASSISLEGVLEIVRRTAGGAVDADAPLMEAGVDSLGAVELRNQLQRALGEHVALSSTLMFDHPTARQVARHVQGICQPASVTVHNSEGIVCVSGASDVEIAGVNVALPTGVAHMSSLRESSHCGVDLLTVIPLSRWDVEEASYDLHDSPPEVKSRVRHGGFVRSAQLFENGFFAISAAEAAAMDPQQRQLLERGYAAAHASGYVQSTLLGTLMAVNVGQWQSEFGSVLQHMPAGRSVYAATGFFCSVTCGRISFALGLQGPCASYDTACSASLVANHGSMRALQRVECDSALSAGVNMIFDPAMMRGNAVAGFISIRGRSHTFDARADGYGRGEAIDAIVCRADQGGAQALAIGSAVRHDGRSASLTAPNGQAQQRVLVAGRADAALTAGEAMVLEAHGTGTALGDPIETGAAAAVFSSTQTIGISLIAGSLKANAGHTEPGAGLAGALKLLMQLNDQAMSSNAHLRVVNPMVRSAFHNRANVAFPIQVAKSESGGTSSGKSSPDSTSSGGVSSFGYSGTITHAIVCTTSVAKQLQPHSLLYRRLAYTWHENEEHCVSSPVHATMHVACWVPLPSSTVIETFATTMLLVAARQVINPAKRVDGPFRQTTIALVLDGNTSSMPSSHAMALNLALTMTLVIHATPARRMLLYTSSAVGGGATRGASGAVSGIGWGFGRVVHLEHPALRSQRIDVSHSARLLSDQILATVPEEPEVVMRNVPFASRLRLRRQVSALGLRHKCTCGVHAITGGLGGLGMRAAALMSKGGASSVVLISRSGVYGGEGEGALAQLFALGSICKIGVGDMSNGADVVALLMRPAPSGVLHAAGVLRDRMVRFMSSDDLDHVSSAKATAASNLHRASVQHPLSTLGFFSSVASTFGNIGQANYAAANAYLDALASAVRLCGSSSSSLQIPAVRGAGMGANAFDTSELDAIGAISLEEFEVCLSISLAVSNGAVERIQVPLKRALLERMADHPALEHGQIAKASMWDGRSVGSSSTLVIESVLSQRLAQLSMKGTQRLAHIETSVLRVVSELTGTPSTVLMVETPLMEAGIDSLAATELSARLRSLSGLSLPATMMLEHPTPRAVAAHLAAQMLGSRVESVRSCAPTYTPSLSPQLCIVDVVGQWPGGCDGDVSRVRLQRTCGNAVGAVPTMRWTLGLVVDVQTLSSAQDLSVRHGGFITCAQRFDADFFGISRAEASVMDPQQRRLLEHGYMALHGSSQRRGALMGKDSGVFLGIERPDWSLAQPPAARKTIYAVTNDNTSAAAGRVSFVLGHQGPCSSIDTACSSALAAMHIGALATRYTSCGMGLGLAVSLKLVPHATLITASAGMLSADGRCKTFDARANGYVRSEGIGALVLEQGGSCDASCILRASALRQDGRSASLTAPNGSAQRVLLRITLEAALLTPSELACVEAHGTGTALGDPTEAGALTELHATRALPLTMCAAKANVGHSEAVSGQIGLLGMILELLVVGGNTQLRVVNPMVRSAFHNRANVAFPIQVAKSESGGTSSGKSSPDSTSSGGVSSFGYSGTITHVILGGQPRAESLTRVHETIQYQRKTFGWDGATKHKKMLPLHLEPDWAPNRWHGKWQANHADFLADHQIGYVPLLSGTSYLQYAREISREVHGVRTLGITDLSFLAFLFLDEFSFSFAITYEPLSSYISYQSITDDGIVQEHAKLRLHPNACTDVREFDASKIECKQSKGVTGDEMYGALGNNYQGEYRSVKMNWLRAQTQEVLTYIEYSHIDTDAFLRASAWRDAVSAQTNELANEQVLLDMLMIRISCA